MFKLGTCCHIGQLHTNAKGETSFKQYNDFKIGTIRVCNMKDLSATAQHDKLKAKVFANLAALKKQVLHISKLPENQRMFRISSDLLPLYGHVDYMHLYDHNAIAPIMQQLLKRIGEIVKTNNIRISTHPSQFITLTSDRPDVVDNSIRDLECAKRIFEYMELSPNECSINIHCNGRSFTLPEHASHLFPWLTIENDEKKAGFDKTITLCEQYNIRMVLDLHHYFCEQGEYLDINSNNFQRVLNTWNGERPYFHISQPRGNENKRELCAHSDYIDDPKLIEYLRAALEYGDCEVEAKYKNLAVDLILKQIGE